jgi:hypothetical protein
LKGEGLHGIRRRRIGDEALATRPAWQRLLTAWVITSVFIPFLIFLFLTLFNLSLTQKALIVFTGSLIWLFILLPFYVMDWDQRRRERIRETCKGDALLKLWQASIDIKADGTSTVKRRISGINFANERKFYEFEAWTDPERNSTYETQLKTARGIKATVMSDIGRRSVAICKDMDVPPVDAYKVNRVVHVIPVAKDEPLKPHDSFDIRFEEKIEENTWKITGDSYFHRVRHVTEKLIFELLLPRKWQFPRLPPTEKIAVGETKDPTCGLWMETPEKPTVEKTRSGRWKISWKIEYPKLLNVYKLTYHSMQPDTHTQPVLRTATAGERTT